MKSTLNGNLPIENYSMCKMRYYRWGGTVTAGKISLLGSAVVPEGRTLVALFMSPICNVHINMSAQGDKIYAWSESYSGAFTYDVLMLLH